jgi:hypothetical protein
MSPTTSSQRHHPGDPAPHQLWISPLTALHSCLPIVVLLQVTCAAGAECRLALATRCQTKVRACVLHRFFYRVFHASSRTRVRGSPPPEDRT